MRFKSMRPTLGRWCSALTGAVVAVGISGVLDAQQAQAPTPQPPAGQPQPATPAQPAGAACGNAAAAQAAQGAVRDANGALIGFTALAEIPGTPWDIHDAARPHPHVITPGAGPGAAPS